MNTIFIAQVTLPSSSSTSSETRRFRSSLEGIGIHRMDCWYDENPSYG